MLYHPIQSKEDKNVRRLYERQKSSKNTKIKEILIIGWDLKLLSLCKDNKSVQENSLVETMVFPFFHVDLNLIIHKLLAVFYAVYSVVITSESLHETRHCDMKTTKQYFRVVPLTIFYKVVE